MTGTREHHGFAQTPQWTPDELATATGRFLAGESASEIGRSFKLTRSAVLGRLNRAGVRLTTAQASARRGNGRNVQAARVRAKSSARPKARAKAKVETRRHGSGMVGKVREPAPTPPPEPTGALARPWIERGFGECNWVLDGPDGAPWSCCEPTTDGASWCPHHHLLGHLASTPSVRDSIRAARRYT